MEPIDKFDHPDCVGGFRWRDCEVRWIEKRIAAEVAATQARLTAAKTLLQEALRHVIAAQDGRDTEQRIQAFLQPSKLAPNKHYPVEWGPSYDRRLTCVCGELDPNHNLVVSDSQAAVDAIVRDLTSRRGLRQEWEEIDEDLQQEIKQTWAAFIQQAIDQGVAGRG